MVANMALTVNVGEPVSVVSLSFPRTYPGVAANVTVTIRNGAPRPYTVRLVPIERLRPEEGSSFTLEEVYGELGPRSTTTLPIQLYLPPDAPPGLHEAAFALERGEAGRMIRVGEVHLALYVGEPLAVRRVLMASMEPGELSYVTIELENLANVDYKAVLSICDVKCPPGGQGALMVVNGTVSRVVPARGVAALRVPVELASWAPPGSYTIVVEVRRV